MIGRWARTIPCRRCRWHCRHHRSSRLRRGGQPLGAGSGRWGNLLGALLRPGPEEAEVAGGRHQRLRRRAGGAECGGWPVRVRETQPHRHGSVGRETVAGPPRRRGLGAARWGWLGGGDGEGPVGGGGRGSRVWGGERRGEARPRGVGRKERRRRTGGGCLLGLLVFVVDAAAGGRAGESWAGLPVHGLLLLPPRAGFFLLGSSGTGWWVNKLAFCFGEFDSHASRNKQSVLETITRFINSTRTTCPLY